MINDLSRELLYPLGFLASIAFGGRMLLQWLYSEYKGRSVVNPTFWKLSLAGNAALALHAFIQLQFHVCLVQVCNGVISWRNLNLMRPSSLQVTTRRTVAIMASMIAAVVALFCLQHHFFGDGSDSWFRVPSAPWNTHGQPHADQAIPFAWHLIGFLGLALFSSRFWIQWWYAEKKQTSYLGSTFWWISLVGEMTCLTYFFVIGDPVNYIGPAFGLIPYMRNLMLIHKTRHREA